MTRVPALEPETMPLLMIHGAAMHAMADGKPEDAAHITAILARRLREADAERDQLRAGLEEVLDVATRWITGDETLNPEQWYAARDYARKVLDEWPL